MLGVIVGWVTNALGMWLIFEPPEPKRILGIKVHGLFLRRQDEAAEVYARIIADDVITLEHIGDFLLDGPRGDRTRQMLADAMRPRSTGRRPGPRRRPGRGGQPAASTTSATPSPSEAVDRTIQPFRDPEFSRRQAEKIYALIARRTKELPPARLRGDDALRDQGGRVDALRPRRDHGVRWRAAPPGDLRSGRSHVTRADAPTAERRRTPALWDEAAEALPGMARIAAHAPGCARRRGRSAPASAPAGCSSGR